MNENSVVSLRQKDDIDDPLTEILRTGARRLITRAVEVEFDTFLASNSDLPFRTAQRVGSPRHVVRRIRSRAKRMPAASLGEAASAFACTLRSYQIGRIVRTEDAVRRAPAVRKGQIGVRGKKRIEFDSTARVINRRAPVRRISVSGSSISSFCRERRRYSRSWRNAPLGIRVVGHQPVTPPSSPRHPVSHIAQGNTRRRDSYDNSIQEPETVPEMRPSSLTGRHARQSKGRR